MPVSLELTTTRSDLNRQAGVKIGEYPRLPPLRGVGVHRGESDFTISVEMPNIPGLERVGNKFGLYCRGERIPCHPRGVLRQKDGEL